MRIPAGIAALLLALGAFAAEAPKYSDPDDPAVLAAARAALGSATILDIERATRDIENITLKCLEKKPANRYPSAQALLEEPDRKGGRTGDGHAIADGGHARAWARSDLKPGIRGARQAG